MNNLSSAGLVLALYPHTLGVSFVLFQDRKTPIEWGIKDFALKETRDKRTVDFVRLLLIRHRPEVVVLEDHTDSRSRRGRRAKRLCRQFVDLAGREVIEVCSYPRAAVKMTFHSVGATTKDDIAEEIAEKIPAFLPRLPKRRRPWDAEDRKHSLFSAAALGLTHYRATEGSAS